MKGLTHRGFPIFEEITDSYGSEVRVQLSSSAEGYYCWIFCQRDGKNSEVAPHLSVAEAEAVASALQEFIAYAKEGK